MNKLALRASLVLLTSALCGCPSTVEPVDVGVDTGELPGTDAPEAMDAGVDAPLPVVDTGGGGTDAGERADGSLLPPTDVGDPFGDTGTVGPPAWVPVEVLTDGTPCPELVACGGDEVDTWDVTGGCFDLPIGEMLSACPGATLSASGRARGRVTFTGTVANRIAQSEVTALAFVPAFCADFLGGCSAVQDLMRMQVMDSVCVDVGDGCDCEARLITTIDDGDAYTIEGNEIVSTASGKRWEYCVTGDELRYRDVSPMGMVEPGIINLGR